MVPNPARFPGCCSAPRPRRERASSAPLRRSSACIRWEALRLRAGAAKRKPARSCEFHTRPTTYFMPQNLDQSLEEVQSKIAYLERAIAELGDVVFRQHKE